MKNKIIVLLACLFSQQLMAQNVGIGTTTPDVSAQLDISASNKGLLIPRVQLTGTTDVVTIPSLTRSLLVYNSVVAGSGATAVIPGFYYWNGTLWEALAVTSGIAKSAWGLNGNTGTNPNLNYIGTADNQSLSFKVNNTTAGYLGIAGNTFWGVSSGNVFSTGANNTAVGAHSLANVTTGYSNVALGTDALRRSTSISNLVAVGDSALFNNGVGATQSFHALYNTAVGSKSLYANTTGYGNTGNGSQTLQNNTAGYLNSAFGYSALQKNLTGNLNSAMGYGALSNNTTGSRNIAGGYLALYHNDFGNSNVAMGVYAAGSSSTGNNLVAIGDSALYQYDNGLTSLTSLYGNNTAVGAKALRGSTSGTINTAVGSFSMELNTLGNFNVAVGNVSLQNNTTGGANTAIGMQSMAQSVTGNNNTAVGRAALYGNNSSGSDNVAVGSNAMLFNVTGDGNTAIGTQSLYSNIFGNYNVVSGYKSMYSNTGGSGNTTMGVWSLTNHKTGDVNVAIGYQSMNDDSSGTNNTAVGGAAMYSNKTGVNNTATGIQALHNNLSGNSNTAIGGTALLNITRGDFNTALGYSALSTASLVNKNTAIGYSADAPSILSTNATAIGANAIANCSNCMVLGSVPGLNGGTANINVGIGTNAPSTDLHINPNGAGSILIGTNKNAGGYTNLEMGINTQSGGYSFIQSTKASGSSLGDLILNQSGGNVGIGVSAPQTDLHVNPNGAGSILIGTNKNSGGYTNLEMGITSQSGGKGYIQSTNASGTSYGDMHLNPNGGYVGINLPTASTAFAPLDIKQSSINRGLRLRNNYNSNGWDIASNGTLNFYVNGLYVLEIGQNGSYNQISDQRLKTNVVKMETVLDKVMALKPSKYQYINNNPTHKISTGFLAQEVMPLFPELISDFKHPTDDTTDNNIYHTINYTGFSIIAIKAIQEQQQQIQSQQQTIDTQNKKLKDFEKRLEALEGKK